MLVPALALEARLRVPAWLACPPLRPASAASRRSREKLRFSFGTLRPPLLAIRRCFSSSMEAKPRFDVRLSEDTTTSSAHLMGPRLFPRVGNVLSAKPVPVKIESGPGGTCAASCVADRAPPACGAQCSAPERSLPERRSLMGPAPPSPPLLDVPPWLAWPPLRPASAARLGFWEKLRFSSGTL